MTATVTTNWLEANQLYLTAALAVVREALEGHASDARGDVRAEAPGPVERRDAHRALNEEAEKLPAPSALETLCAAFGLSPFERDVLLLCAGVQLDSSFAPLCAAAQGDPRRAYPTLSLALAALPGAHWTALTPAAPLRSWRLVEVGAGDTLTSSPLRIDERVLHYLTGVAYLDERLQGLMRPLPPPSELPPSHQDLARRIAGLWPGVQGPSEAPIVQLCGGDHGDRQAIAAAACAALGVHLHAIRAADVPLPAAEREGLARLWRREAILSGSALLLECDDLDSSDHMAASVSFVEHLAGMLIVTGPDPLPLRKRLALRLDVHRASATEQRALWYRALGSASRDLNGHVEAVAGQFQLGLQGIHAACAWVTAGLSRGETEPGPMLWDACRAQARRRLDDLAQRIEPAATWDDLVLPGPQTETLREIAAQVRHRSRVYETWGFAAKGARGLGIGALFAGPSGTGKTMASEVLAGELRLDLYRIDLSQVVSKYIGETEKNLRRVFDAAEEGGAILLFDEADALFGKRSEVKDSHDRYANIEISYLLQRMEAYRGLAVLTTNMKSALDPAFLRRIRFVIDFPFPDLSQRARIWRRIFPPQTPTDGLNVSKLALLNVAGGSIRNIAVNAAFLAAESGQPVSMGHLVRATRSEYGKLEKPLTQAEIEGWV